MTDQTKISRSRDEQIAALTAKNGEEGAFSRADDQAVAESHILEAEARGAAEARAEGVKVVGALEARVSAENERSFKHGYLIACCNLVNLHDEPSLAWDVLAEGNLNTDDLELIDLPEYDATALVEIRDARGGRDPIRAAGVAGEAP